MESVQHLDEIACISAISGSLSVLHRWRIQAILLAELIANSCTSHSSFEQRKYAGNFCFRGHSQSIGLPKSGFPPYHTSVLKCLLEERKSFWITLPRTFHLDSNCHPLCMVVHSKSDLQIIVRDDFKSTIHCILIKTWKLRNLPSTSFDQLHKIENLVICTSRNRLWQ